MAELRQTINMAKISPLAKRIDSVSYNNSSSPLDSDNAIKAGKGLTTIENKIIGEVESDSDETIKRLSLEVHIVAEGDTPFYSLDLSTSGLYSAPAEFSADEVDRALLTEGFQDLYAYTKAIVSVITHGGPYGEAPMPILSAQVSSE